MQDLEIIKKIKSIMERYGYDPEVKKILGLVLAHSSTGISKELLDRLNYAVANAMAKKFGGMHAFKETCNNEYLIEQISQIAKDYGYIDSVSECLNEILDDGKVTDIEYQRLLLIVEEAKNNQRLAPARVAPIPYPKLDYIPDGMKRGKKNQEDEDE